MAFVSPPLTADTHRTLTYFFPLPIAFEGQREEMSFYQKDSLKRYEVNPAMKRLKVTCVLSNLFQVFFKRHSFPLAFVCYGQWEGMGSQAEGISTGRRARQAHDTKRSDWHGTGRLELVRTDENNLPITQNMKQRNSFPQSTNYSIKPLSISYNSILEGVK